MMKLFMSLTPTLSCHEPLIENFFDDSIFLDELFKDDLVMHTTSLKHVDHNFEDECVDNEPIFLKELFKGECDHSFEKTCVEELKSRVPFEKRKLDLSNFTFDEPSNNQSFENWVEVNITDEKDQSQVYDFKIDILLESTVRQQNQKESVFSSESFMESLFKTTIEVSDVPRSYIPKCLAQPFHFDENKTRMDEVLEDVKPVKIDIPLLNVIKQLLAYAILLKKNFTQIRKPWTHISTCLNAPLSRFKDHA